MPATALFVGWLRACLRLPEACQLGLIPRRKHFSFLTWRYLIPAMGLDINLQDERGVVQATISDPQNLLHRLLERSFADEPQLMEIDWYGNTVFNPLQMPRFLSQWKILATHCKTPEEAKIVEDVKALAMECEGAVHLYLKFVGD